MNSYRLGTDVKVTGIFENLSGAVYDPSTVTVKVQKPDGTETSYVYLTAAEVIKVSTGVYYIWLAPTLTGKYVVRFKGTGTVRVADESSFIVNKSAFATP